MHPLIRGKLQVGFTVETRGQFPGSTEPALVIIGNEAEEPLCTIRAENVMQYGADGKLHPTITFSVLSNPANLPVESLPH